MPLCGGFIVCFAELKFILDMVIVGFERGKYYVLLSLLCMMLLRLTTIACLVLECWKKLKEVEKKSFVGLVVLASLRRNLYCRKRSEKMML